MSTLIERGHRKDSETPRKRNVCVHVYISLYETYTYTGYNYDRAAINCASLTSYTLRFGLVGLLGGLTPQQQPGSYQGGEMMMMKSVIWWRKPEYPEEMGHNVLGDDLHNVRYIIIIRCVLYYKYIIL